MTKSTDISSFKLLFAGDTHGELKHLERLQSDLPIIHLGDAAPLHGMLKDVLSPGLASRFWFIPGNHDYDREQYMLELLHGGLEEKSLHATVKRINGVRVAGLGGVFMQRVWHPELGPPVHETRQHYLEQLPKKDRQRMPMSVAGAIWFEDYERLFDQKADVLVTHEAPGCHKNGFKELDELAEAMGCALIVHGHHHQYYQTTVNNGRTHVLGVGLRGICTAQGERLIPGELDDQRMGRWRDTFS